VYVPSLKKLTGQAPAEHEGNVVNPVGVVIRQSHETPGSVSASVKVPVI
jgi:hypothetical protein